MSMGRPGIRATLAALVLPVLLSACTDEERPREAGDWSATDTLLPKEGLVWSGDGVVHLGNGDTVDVGEPIAAFVVAGDGVYYLGEGPDGQGWTDLRYAPADGGTVVRTGSRPEPGSITASPDGRYLGFVDRAEVPATTVVVDLTTGAEVVASSDGLTDSGDLEAAYDEVEPAVLAIDEQSAWVETLDGVLEFDLESGEGRDSDKSADDVRPEEGDLGTVPSPSGDWSVDNESPRGPHLVHRTGRQVRAVLTEDDVTSPLVTDRGTGWDDSIYWALSAWKDDATAVGIVDYGDASILVECPVSTGDCAPVPGGRTDARWPLDRP